jgi:hypothetical protein
MDITNASFASPLADATYARIVGNPQIGSVLTTLSDLNGWAIALTIFLILVAYDQCKWRRAIHASTRPAHSVYSQLHLAQGFNCWPGMESPLYRTVPLLNGAKMVRICREMGQRTAELRVGFPQASFTLLLIVA